MSARQRVSTRERHSEPPASAAPGRSLAPVAVAVGVAAFLLHLLQYVLLPFVIAAIVGYVCAPLVDWLAARTRLPRWLPAVSLLLTLLGVAVLVGLMGVPPLLRRLQSVTSDLHGSVAQFAQAMIGRRSVQLFGSTLDAQHLADLVVGGARDEITGGRILSLVGYSVAAAFGYLLIWVLVAYFLLDMRAIAAGLLWLVPPGSRPRAQHVWRELNPLLRRYFIGVTIVVAYATVAAYLGLGLVLGLHHAAILALLTGFLEIVPLVGPLAAAALGGLVAVQQAVSSWGIVAYIGYAIALRLSIDQLIGPIVLGSAASVRPMVVIFGFLVGGALFGIVGIILAVPFALAVKVALSVSYRES